MLKIPNKLRYDPTAAGAPTLFALRIVLSWTQKMIFNDFHREKKLKTLFIFVLLEL